MGRPAAKQNDRVTGTDTHILMVPSPGGPVPTPTPMPFQGMLSGSLSPDVLVDNQPAAVEGSTAANAPGHVPSAGPFQKPPSDQGTIQMGSSSVLINSKAAARDG